MQNLAELLMARRLTTPDAIVGLADNPIPYRQLFDRAASLSDHLLATSALRARSRVAVIGQNGVDYLAAWIACQLAGVECALLNPAYPTALIGRILEDLVPTSVLWVDQDVDRGVFPESSHIDISECVRELAGHENHGDPNCLPGFSSQGGDVAGYMHTSGTTGVPKLCAQSHSYFIRMGRTVADRMLLNDRDVVFAPLPLFHVNPMGYGFVGALSGGASFLTERKFSASTFWQSVASSGTTVLILHGPPIEILKRSGRTETPPSHRVRMCLYTDLEFLRRFRIPMALSGYGSTEVGGVSHIWIWRPGDEEPPEGASHYGGIGRPDIEWRIVDGEIQIRERQAGSIFSGYLVRGEMVNMAADDGWYATGDLGRVDEGGNLVFLERLSDSIRILGEYVPIDFVENHFVGIDGVDDVALWKEPGQGDLDSRLMLFVTGSTRDRRMFQSRANSLPRFMRPQTLRWVSEIPRDDGVGKIRRRVLGQLSFLEEMELS